MQPTLGVESPGRGISPSGMPSALPGVNRMNPLAGIYGSRTKVSDIELPLVLTSANETIL